VLVLTSLFPVHEVASHAFLSVVYSFSAQSVPLAPAASIVLQRRYAIGYATLDPPPAPWEIGTYEKDGAGWGHAGMRHM
jgi:hypothetical protein